MFDVFIAAAVIAFNVSADKRVYAQASQQKILVEKYQVIYNLLDKIKALMISRIPVEYLADVKGEAEVLQVFSINVNKKRQERVAGCRIGSGSITRAMKARVMRGDVCLWRGSLKTLKHVKKDINEAVKGSECGIGLDGFEEVEIGDKIQSFVDVEKIQTL